MSSFHSTVSRRDFMKAVGLGAAGLGAAAATTPVFHDLDEVASATPGIKHPWYANELELDTVAGAEVDWQVFQRYDPRTTDYYKTGDRKDVDRYVWMKERFPEYGGQNLRGEALTRSEGIAGRGPSVDFFGQLDDTRMRGPEDYGDGFPKWTGTPEENLRTLYSAFRFFGAAQVGVVPLNSKTKKFVCAMDGKREVNFVDGPAERTDDEVRIPNTYSNLLMFTTLEATSEVRHAPTSTTSGYNQYGRVTCRVHYFLHSLGYGHLDGGRTGRWTQSNPFGALAGVGEHSRACYILTSYKYGNMQRGIHRIFTDMPLAPTHPVDAGCERFCRTCKSCAELCPYESMPLGDPDWEPELAEDRDAGNFIPGFKGYRRYFLVNRCGMCKNCHGTCPFNGADSLIHTLIRMTQGTVPIFNGFFANMHDLFGYGDRNPDTFWEMDMPMGPHDPWFVKPL